MKQQLLLLLLPSLLFSNIDITSMRSIEKYIDEGYGESESCCYFHLKERAVEVLDILRAKSDLKHLKELDSINAYYKELDKDLPNSVFPNRVDIILKHTRNKYLYWKKIIEADRQLIIEDYMGGTGAYYGANMHEIEEHLKNLGFPHERSFMKE